jgi:hypothetical protein
MKGCGRQIVFWGIIILSTWIFASLMGKNDWGPIIGFIVGFIVAWQVISEWNKSEKRERDIKTVSRNQGWIVRDFGQDSEGYTVIYQRGHKGIDHYLRMYAKRDEIPGTLALSDIGIRFVCTTTRTEQKFTLSWQEVRGASHSTEDTFLGQKAWLRVDTTKYGLISFTTESAPTIASQITNTLFLRKHRHFLLDNANRRHFYSGIASQYTG